MYFRSRRLSGVGLTDALRDGDYAPLPLSDAKLAMRRSLDCVARWRAALPLHFTRHRLMICFARLPLLDQAGIDA